MPSQKRTVLPPNFHQISLQMNDPILRVPFEILHNCVESACQRPVYTHEFSSLGHDKLKAEVEEAWNNLTLEIKNGDFKLGKYNYSKDYGKVEKPKDACPVCGGTGGITFTKSGDKIIEEPKKQQCPACQGTGEERG